MDGTVSAARRSPAQLSGRSFQEPVLLLWLQPWRRRDSLRRTLSPGEVPASPGPAPPVARLAALITANPRVLSHAAGAPHGGQRLPGSTRNPVTGSDRAYADRLRSRRMSAPLPDSSRLSAAHAAPSGSGQCRRL